MTILQTELRKSAEHYSKYCIATLKICTYQTYVFFSKYQNQYAMYFQSQYFIYFTAIEIKVSCTHLFPCSHLEKQQHHTKTVAHLNNVLNTKNTTLRFCTSYQLICNFSFIQNPVIVNHNNSFMDGTFFFLRRDKSMTMMIT